MLTQLLNACANAWHAHDLSTCKPLGFDLVGWAAIVTVLVPGTVYVIRHLFKRGRERSKSDRVSAFLWKSRFRVLCSKILPLMAENGRIFRKFGPNSGAKSSGSTLRQDVSVWKRLLPKVVRNNARIRDLILANEDAIPDRYLALFQAWADHILAFEAHAQDDRLDYRDHQFPTEIVEVVQNNA